MLPSAHQRRPSHALHLASSGTSSVDGLHETDAVDTLARNSPLGGPLRFGAVMNRSARRAAWINAWSGVGVNASSEAHARDREWARAKLDSYCLVCNVLAVHAARRSHDQRRLRPEKRLGAGRQRPHRLCLRTDAPSRAGVSHEVRADGSKAGPHKAGLKGPSLMPTQGETITSDYPLHSHSQVHQRFTRAELFHECGCDLADQMSFAYPRGPWTDLWTRGREAWGSHSRVASRRDASKTGTAVRFLGHGGPVLRSRSVGKANCSSDRTNVCRPSPGSSIGYLTLFVRRNLTHRNSHASDLRPDSTSDRTASENR